MAMRLEGLVGAVKGRQLPITPQRPITLKTQKGEEDAGEVTIEAIDGQCVFTSRSRMTCTVNGKPTARVVLADGDQLGIGKQRFLVVLTDTDDGDTTAQHIAIDSGSGTCSACDGPFDSAGWSNGEQYLCRRCLGKGVKPDHLPRPRSAKDVAALIDPNPTPIPAPRAASIDARQVVAPRPVRPEEQNRRSKRISASQLAQVEAEPPKRAGLFRKVGQVFTSRDERRRLETLERERQALLFEAGRMSLTHSGGFGLPDRQFAQLLRGTPVTLHLQDLSVVDLESWQSQCQRLSYLDAEIAAARRSLGLEPDPASKKHTQPLPTAQRAAQDRAFQAMDGLQTEENFDLEVPPAVSAIDSTTTAALPPEEPEAVVAKPPVTKAPTRPPAPAAKLPVSGTKSSKSPSPPSAAGAQTTATNRPAISGRRRSLRRRH